MNANSKSASRRIEMRANKASERTLDRDLLVLLLQSATVKGRST
jgi:hypothetical protein